MQHAVLKNTSHHTGKQNNCYCRQQYPKKQGSLLQISGADVIREAAEAYEEATGISVEIQWKGRGIRSLIEPALDAGEQIDLFDDDYQRMAQEHRDYLAELKGMADTVDYEKHIMPQT